MAKRISWKIGNGRTVKFWKDCWFKNGIYLRDVALNPPNDFEVNKSLSEYILQNGAWDMSRLSHYLPEDICDELSSSCPVLSNNVEDTVV